MPTKADIRNDILKHLGVIGANESPSAADAQDVETAIDGRYEELVTDGVAYWGANDYPNHVRRLFMQIVSWDVAHQFAVPDQRLALLRDEASSAYRRLVGQTSVKDESGVPVRADYF